MVGTRYFASATNGRYSILQLWADVKYHVPTGFGFSPKASVFYVFVSVPLPSIFPLNRFFGEIEILFIFVGCNLIGFSDDDTTMVFDFDGGGGWYGGWRG